MRRIAHVDAPLAFVRDLLHDVATWPRWMPGMAAVRVLERGGDRLRAEVGQSVLGQTWRQTVEVRLASGSVRVRALDGLLRWSAQWGFRAPPDGDGTTFSLELATDPGLLGRATRGTFHRVNDHRFDETVAAVARQAAARAPAPAAGRRLLVVYETPDGFEVEYAGRTYVARQAAAIRPGDRNLGTSSA